MPTSVKLESDPEGNNIDIKLYRSAIDKLLYLIVSRLNILFVVGICAHYHSCVKESHMSACRL